MNCDVSVVIPAFNASGTLGRALGSVYAQSARVREIIVVDDGSDDREQSRSIVTAGTAGLPCRFLQLDQNQGVAVARNAGIDASCGQYLAFLDADDVWFEEKIATQYALMRAHHFDFSMHRYRADLHRRPPETQPRAAGLAITWTRFSRWTPLWRNDTTSTVMVLREKMVRYDPGLRRGEDFKCYMELLSRGCQGVYIRSILAGAFKSTIGAGGLSQDIEGMHRGRMVALEKLSDPGGRRSGHGERSRRRSYSSPPPGCS